MIALPPNTHARRRTLGLAVALMLAAAPAAHADNGGAAIVPATPTASAAASTTGAAPAATPVAPTTGRPQPVGSAQVRHAQQLLRLKATGKHDANTRKVVRRFQSLRGLSPYGVIDLTTYQQIRAAFALVETGGSTIDPTTGTSATPAADGTTNALAPITPRERAILDRIAKCESGGDPTAVSSNGLYRGKYQFDTKTWSTVGGTGDPAAASEAEQDQRAAILLRRRGTAPWPVCGS